MNNRNFINPLPETILTQFQDTVWASLETNKDEVPKNMKTAKPAMPIEAYM